jgi:hypothetical protein
VEGLGRAPFGAILLTAVSRAVMRVVSPVSDWFTVDVNSWKGQYEGSI